MQLGEGTTAVESKASLLLRGDFSVEQPPHRPSSSVERVTAGSNSLITLNTTAFMNNLDSMAGGGVASTTHLNTRAPRRGSSSVKAKTGQQQSQQ